LQVERLTWRNGAAAAAAARAQRTAAVELFCSLRVGA